MRSHPLTEFPASIFPILSESLYTLLQTIADVIPYLPVGGPLLEMAVKCWGVSFPSKDHQFLHKSVKNLLNGLDELKFDLSNKLKHQYFLLSHRSKIFRHLSQIMSQFDGESEWSKSLSGISTSNQWDTTTAFDDVTANTELKVSSRNALSGSLTDDSTETFWESGDEDRFDFCYVLLT